LEDLERPMQSITHISTQHAYEYIRDELSTIEDLFYPDFAARNLRKSPTKDDWKNFAIPSKLNFSNDDETYDIFYCLEILKILDVMYRTRNYCSTFDDEFVNNDYSGI
jgi:hypothetical protein